MDFLKLFNAGGYLMYPLFICSILVWAICIDKFRRYSFFKKQIKCMVQSAKELVKENKYHEARGLGHNVQDWIKSPYLQLFDDKNSDRQIKEDKIARRLDEVSVELAKGNWILATIASISPFLGLLGTVIGIIRSFESISMSGKSGFSIIAPGLAEALITTAAGIIVAIMALIIFNYFQMRLRIIMITYKNDLEDLLDEF